MAFEIYATKLLQEVRRRFKLSNPLKLVLLLIERPTLAFLVSFV